MKPLGSRVVIFVSLSLLFLSLSPQVFAQTITVISANPNNAPQGTVNLNVLINGKGFKNGAISKFYVSGTTDPGGVTVNSTTFVSSGQLKANINVASNATATQFDVVVSTADGRSGKGTKLFAVTIPDPTIAYTISDSTSNYLMVMNADGTDQAVVLQESKQAGISIRTPNWSPDGTQIVFVSNIQGPGIYIINKDGSGLRKVIGLNNGSSFAEPVWSPAPAADNNWKIAFTDQPLGQSDNDLFLVNLDGTGLINLTNTPDRQEYYPAWDPFATRLAGQVYPCLSNVSCTSYLYEYNLGLVSGSVAITNSVNLTAAGPLNGAYVFASDWARTQDRIAVEVLLPGANYGDVWVINLVDPSHPFNLTNTPTVTELSPSWSPQDSKIMLRRSAPGNTKEKTGIFIINPDGSGLTDLGVTGDQLDWRRCCPTCTNACAP